MKMKFRKKPVVIDAVKWTGTEKSMEECLEFIADGKPDFEHLPSDGVHIHKGVSYCAGQIFIPTLEGVMTASEGDWIIKGVKGEFYPCKPDIFEATYEKVED
jgi:hypothetical protein